MASGVTPQAAALESPSTMPYVDIEQLLEQPKKALQPVLRLLNGWEKAEGAALSVEQLSGAMTNLVYRCALLQGQVEQEVVLVRIHASKSELFNREEEIATFKAVGETGVGPRLLLLFGNGRVEEFLQCHVTLTAADLRQPDVSAAIAAALAAFHVKLSMALSSAPQHQSGVICWERCQHWAALALHVCGGTLAEELGLEGIEEEITRLEQYLMSHHPCWIAMCHNDLQYGNIMALPATPPASPFAGAAQQQHAVTAVTSAAQRGVSPIRIDALSKQLHALAVASSAASAKTPLGSSPASSGGSFVMLRGRHGSNVQLEDGSMAFPGVKVRVRGQSPDAKRPGGGSPASDWSFRGAASSVGATVASSSVCGDEEDSWLGDSDSEEGDGAEGGQVAAAVECLRLKEREQKASRLRHVSSGPALAMLLPSSTAGERAAAASSSISSNIGSSRSGSGGKAAGKASGVKFAVGPSLAVEAGGDGLVSSEDSDDLLPAAAAAADDDGGGWRLKEIAASKSRSGQKYRALRQSKRTPAPGMEFPACGVKTESEECLTEEGLDDGDEVGESGSGAGDDSAEAGGLNEEGPAAPAPSFASTVHPSFRRLHSPTQSTSTLARSAADSCSLVNGRSSAAGDGGDGDSECATAVSARATAVTSPVPQPAAADSIRLIDYEYSGFNPVVLDIANHWCEWAANYHTEQAHVLDFGKLPNEAEQEHFVACYLAALLTAVGVQLPSSAVVPDPPPPGPSSAAAAAGDDDHLQQPAALAVPAAATADGLLKDILAGGSEPTSKWRSLPYWLQQALQGSAAAAALDDVAWEGLVQSVVQGSRAYMAVSHLLWALWGYIQAQVSDVDFDFMSYGQQRWQQYLLTRPQAVATAAAATAKMAAVLVD